MKRFVVLFVVLLTVSMLSITADAVMIVTPMSDADADGWNMDQAETMTGLVGGGPGWITSNNLDALWELGGPGGPGAGPGVHSTISAMTLDKSNMAAGSIMVNMAPLRGNYNGAVNIDLGTGIDLIPGNADDWTAMTWGSDNAWGGGDDVLWYQARIYDPMIIYGYHGILYELYLEGSFHTDNNNFNMTMGYNLPQYSFISGIYNGPVGQGSLFAVDPVGFFPVPEPTSLLLLGTGLVGIIGSKRWKK